MTDADTGRIPKRDRQCGTCLHAKRDNDHYSRCIWPLGAVVPSWAREPRWVHNVASGHDCQAWSPPMPNAPDLTDLIAAHNARSKT